MAKLKQGGITSDYMSRKWDENLEELTESLTAAFASAERAMRRELNALLSAFKTEDAARAAQVTAGEITKDAYLQWRNYSILQQEAYKQSLSNMTRTLTNTDALAMAMVRNELPYALAESFDFVQALGNEAAIAAGLDGLTFSIYNTDSVAVLLTSEPDLLPYINERDDLRFNRQRINTVITRAIMNGDGIPMVAQSLSEVTALSAASAVRTARTCMTAAENLGRSAGAERVRAHGVPVIERWSATHDGRTRYTHRLLDGTVRDDNGVFGADILENPLRFPGDPQGDAGEVYNCRCRLNVELVGIDHTKDEELYIRFMQENYPENYNTLVARGKISEVA